MKIFVPMTDQDYRIKAKNWINHKLILSKKSQWYDQRNQRHGIFYVKEIFSSFLTHFAVFQTGLLALKFVNNKKLLYAILPCPLNDSYDKARIELEALLDHSWELIHKYNLKELVK